MKVIKYVESNLGFSRKSMGAEARINEESGEDGESGQGNEKKR